MQDLMEEHIASVLSGDTSHKSSPLHKLSVQPDPFHRHTVPESAIQQVPCITPEKQEQPWTAGSSQFTSACLASAEPCSKKPQNASKQKQQQKTPTPSMQITDYRTKHYFIEALGTKHCLYRCTSPTSHQLQDLLQLSDSILSSQSFFSATSSSDKIGCKLGGLQRR